MQDYVLQYQQEILPTLDGLRRIDDALLSALVNTAVAAGIYLVSVPAAAPTRRKPQVKQEVYELLLCFSPQIGGFGSFSQEAAILCS